MLAAPLEVLGTTTVEGLKCQRMKLGEPDASGRARPIPIEGETFVLNVDQVIVALGTSPNPLIKQTCQELETTKKGTIVVNEDTMKTSIDGIYAGGDAVTGAATVILAMGAGRLAAKSIIAKLKG